ncbi:MAG: DegQ family serine endoprotease [Desulfobacterales bacterium]|nr:DegQ family serine endoprotease [Desulfobacterales bacterium]
MISTTRCRSHDLKYLPFFLVAALLAVMIPRLAAAQLVPDSFADLAEELGPTVVNIYTTQRVKVSMPEQFMFPDMDRLPEQFRQFFNFPSPRGQKNGQPREFERSSLGSGVITSADGYILTNNHVVQDADEISVILANYEEHKAKIIGRDPKTDLALIKIEPNDPLPFVTMGDSDKLRVGDWVMAIGNPFGLEQTVTAGIVSAKGRSINRQTYGNFIQTDASINPGNSGGPLFDLKGRMVGINTAIFSRGGGNIGIGFAIPVNMARNVMTQLKEHGSVTRGWLGVRIQQVSPDLAKKFDMKRPIGALVGELIKDSPADKAGIKQGDVIVSFKGKEIKQMSLLPAIVAQTTVGERAEVVVIRNGKRKKLTVTIGKLEEEQVVGAGSPTAPSRELGLTVQQITPELARSLDIEEKTGLIISDVAPGSPAAEAGLHRGEIILEVNRTPVESIKAYTKMMRKRKDGESILLLVKRDGHTRYVVLKDK